MGIIHAPLPAVHASSAHADSVLVCGVGHEEWRRDHPRPAAKRPANLNAGEPRTVRMIYFLPSDRPYRQEVVDSMKVVIRRVQIFYADQMDAHGYGRKTFRLESDTRGEPIVHLVDGSHPESHYYNTFGGAMVDELWQVFDFDVNIYSIIIDTHHATFQGRGGGGERDGKTGGSAWLTSGYIGADAHGGIAGVTAHEIGHAFGLPHDFRDGAYTMSYGQGGRLSACAAEFLAVHPYFDPDIPTEEGTPPTIKLISPTEYPAGSKSVSVRLKVSDTPGVHQVILLVSSSRGGAIEFKACRGVSDKRDAVVQFEYDGVIPSEIGTSLSNPISHPIIVEAIDTNGNVHREEFGLAKGSKFRIATLEGHTDLVRSLSFSHDGTLASGSWDGTARMWNIGTRRQVARLQQGSHDERVVSVAFSPEGDILAVVSLSTGLWDVVTRRRIANLRGEGQPYSAAFSPDGTLALGLWNGEIELWNVETRRQIAVLTGHSAWVRTVAFSQDGTHLFSGTRDGIELWHMADRERIATLKGHRHGVTSVSPSPDGGMLASGSEDKTVILWDVATRQKIATLKGHTHWIEAVSFLPDGTLVSGDARGTIILWNVATQEQIAEFGQAGGVHSVALSPDAGILASGSGDGTLALWDMSVLTVPRPSALEIISGVEQQGSAGATLANPFFVLVVDQNGKPVVGATVTFAVTAGGGTLSVETATTDENGRAATTLTLGSQPGTNTVVASVADLKPVAFTATGLAVARTLDKPSGDEQEGPPGLALNDPFVVEVRDQNGNPLAGATVTFAVTAGAGTLSDTTATTDANGRAATTLTLGPQLGTNTVVASVPDLEPVTFTAVATAKADFDGDGTVGFSDFVQFAGKFGLSEGDDGYDARFDLDGNGAIGFSDFLIFANAFGNNTPSS